MMSVHKSHAEHNELACEFLSQDGRFNDWVITTAFYSALHYVHHELFPLQEGEFTFSSLDEICSSMQSGFSNPGKNKHSMLKTLVRAKCSTKCFILYRKLFDQCHNARYVSYQVSKQSADDALKTLQILKMELKKQ